MKSIGVKKHTSSSTYVELNKLIDGLNGLHDENMKDSMEIRSTIGKLQLSIRRAQYKSDMDRQNPFKNI